MDAHTMLALMGKAKRVFESPDTFLSFPALTPLSYSPAELRFDTAAINYDVAVEFSRLVNSIPSGVLFQPEEGPQFWEIYRDLFSTAEVASGGTSTGDESRRASEYLYTIAADGGRSESEAALAYRQYRDAYIAALEEYKNAEITAAVDSAAHGEWQDQPKFRKKVGDALAAWESQGFRSKVEAARAVIQRSVARAPQATWEEWRQSFNEDIVLVDAPRTGQQAPITGFSPYDAFDLEWPSFQVSRTEITELVAGAPEELKRMFLAGSGDSAGDLERLSFEFRSVAVTRPWLESEVFRARTWRLPATVPPLSDAGSPPRGQCPAYVAGVIFARNVSVVKQTPGGGTPAPGKLTIDPRLLEKLNFHNKTNMIRPGILAKPPVHNVPRPAPIKRPPVAVAPHPGQRFGPGLKSRLAARPAFASAPGAVRLQKSVMVKGPPPPIGSPVPPMPAPAVAPAPVLNEISILAFICRRMDLCPNPDPSLQW